jgi:polynucleotide 5'-triphosphatase
VWGTMNINALIDARNDEHPTPSSSVTSSPNLSRRQTVSSLLNFEDDRPTALNNGGTVTTPKPKRYKVPPIWAQKWRSKIGGRINPEIVAQPVRNNKSEGSVSGLPASISGVTPYEDLTRKITEWVYSHLMQLNEERQYVEVEFKMGTICNKQTDRRIDLPVVTETLVNAEYAKSSTRFVAALSDEQFSNANVILDGLAGNSSTNNSTITLTKKNDARTRDLIYTNKKSAGNIRTTLDESDQMVACICKRRVSDLVVYSPGDLLDYRISISVETPYDEPSKLKALPPTLIRNKNRQSYTQKGVQVDLTSVISGDSGKSTKELELELDGPLLTSFFDSFNDRTDPRAMDKFEELIKLGLDNTRVMARKLGRP